MVQNLNNLQSDTSVAYVPLFTILKFTNQFTHLNLTRYRLPRSKEYRKI